MVKLVLVLLVLLLSAVHDFAVGPRAAALKRADPDSVRARSLGRLASRIARANLLLTLAILALAVMLVRC